MVMMEQDWNKNTNQEMITVIQSRDTGREMDGFGIFFGLLPSRGFAGGLHVGSE